MSKLKVIGSIVCFVGIAILTVGGATGAEIGALVPVGVGIGTVIGGLVAFFKKE